MFYLLSGITARIVSNSCISVFQKILTSNGTSSSVVNFLSYAGLALLCLFLLPFVSLEINLQILINFVIMGILGALGNYFIIKALSIGELSSLAPINSYKPVVALIIAFLYLGEIPNPFAIFGFLLIILGTYILHGTGKCNRIAVFYRVLALIFSGTEAVFIKKILLLTNVPVSFILWVFSGLIFSFLFVITSKHRIKITKSENLLFLILSIGIMQFSTNYVFSKMNVSYALAIFQLSTVLSVFFGVNIFKENGLKKKILASLIMALGAIILIIL